MYKINNEIEEKIVKYVITNKKFFLGFRNVLNKVSSNIVFADIISISSELWDSGCEEISIPVLKNKVENLKRDIPNSIYFTTLEKLQNITLTEDEKTYIESVLHKINKFQITQAAIDDVQDNLNSEFPDLDKIHETLNIIRQPTEEEAQAVLHGQNIKENILKRHEQKQHKIPSRISSLDRSLRGGFGRQELTMFAAPSGFGKTNLLVNFAYSALLMGYNVLFFSLELSKLMLTERINMRMCRCTDEKLVQDIEKVEEYIKRFYNTTNSKLYIQEAESDSLVVDDLEAIIGYLKLSNGFVPDIILLDYLELLKLPQKNKYEEEGKATRAFRELNKKWDTAGVIVTQCDKKVAQKFPLYARDIRGSGEKLNISDYSAILCKEEQPDKFPENVGVLYEVKNRSNPGRKGKLIPLKLMLDRMIITDLGYEFDTT
jgi:replicative DNA helicase